MSLFLKNFKCLPGFCPSQGREFLSRIFFRCQGDDSGLSDERKLGKKAEENDLIIFP